LQFVLAEVGAGGQAEAIGKEFLGHSAADRLAAGLCRLQVHRFPDGARFDVFRVERQADGLTVGAERVRVYGDDGSGVLQREPETCGSV
jgi:hypothetical protein